MTELLTRPNGKPYCPRSVRVHRWEDDADTGYTCGVIVLGTHDLERAQRLAERACQHWYGMHAFTPHPGWYRLGIRRGEPTWIVDTVRGAAGVHFTASEDGVQ